MRKNFDALFAGNMGFFWLSDDGTNLLGGESASGYVKINDRGVFELETLQDDPLSHDPDDMLASPLVVCGVTTTGSAIFLQVHATRASIAGGKASVRQFEAYTAVYGVDVGNVKSVDVSEIQIFFPGVERWAGITVSDESTEKHADGRNKSYSLKVESVPRETIAISDDRQIALSSYWSVDGTRSERSVFMPVSISCYSERPVDLWRLLEPLLRVQDLLSLAFDGFICAKGGVVDLDAREKPGTRPSFWNHFLMTTLPGVKVPKSETILPIFGVSSIGGMEGITKWISLCDQHPRLVKPLVNPFRRGTASPELRLMELAAAMEYWCAAKKKSEDFEWARTLPVSLAIVQHLGDACEEWLGEPGTWADLFWSRYNSLKHDPSFTVDESEIDLLARIGARVLTAEVLSQISSDEGIVRRYLSNHQLNNLGTSAKRYFGTLGQS